MLRSACGMSLQVHCETSQTVISHGSPHRTRFGVHRTPWDDPAFAAASVAAPALPSMHAPGQSPAAAPGGTTAAGVPSYLAMPAVPKSVVRRRAEFEVEQAQEQYKKQLVSLWMFCNCFAGNDVWAYICGTSLSNCQKHCAPLDT